MDSQTGVWSDFDRLHVVGKGSFGTAILCRRKCDSSLLVLKQVDLRGMKATARKSALKEAQLLSMLQHQNIVTYYGSRLHDGQLFIEMEFCSEGTLARFLSRLSKPLPELDVLSIFRQILSALAYLDDMNILHRDLKTSNIFLATGFVLRVGDFGIAKVLTSEKSAATSMIGTPMNFSPEVCEGRTFSLKSDIWASGCILYEIVCLKQTFEAENLALLIKNIVRGSYKAIKGPYSRGLKKLVAFLLHKNPDMRPRAYEALETVNSLLIERQVDMYHALWTSGDEPTGYTAVIRQSWNQRNQAVRSLVFQLIISPYVHLERVNLPHGIHVKQISKSRTHTLLLTDNCVYEITRNMFPTRISRLRDVVKVAAGDHFSLFLCERGLVMSSGDMQSSWYKNSAYDHLYEHCTRDPEVLDSLFSIDVSDISCASDHVVVCSRDGQVYAWGVNSSGCLGLGEHQFNRLVSQPEVVTFPSGTEIEKVFCADNETMFIDKKQCLWASGSNEFKKLGLQKAYVCIPTRVPGINEPVTSVSLGATSSCVLLQSRKAIVFGKSHKDLDVKAKTFSESLCKKSCKNGTVVDLGNGIVKVQSASSFNINLTVENDVYFWGSRTRKRHSNRSSRMSRTLSKVSDTLKGENIVIGETDASLMDVVQHIGPDNPVVLVREPKLVARDLKQLREVDGREELFLRPELIVAVYSSQIHLKQGETIGISEVFAFSDDSVYVVIDTSLETCYETHQDEGPDSYSVSGDTLSESSDTLRDMCSSCEGMDNSDDEVPAWLRELGDCDSEPSAGVVRGAAGQSIAMRRVPLHRSMSSRSLLLPVHDLCLPIERRQEGRCCCILM